ELEVLEAAGLGAQERILWQRRHAALETAGVKGLALQDRHLAGVGVEEAAGDRERRGLAGPVGADEAVERAARHREGEPAQGLDGAEALANLREAKRAHRSP